MKQTPGRRGKQAGAYGTFKNERCKAVNVVEKGGEVRERQKIVCRVVVIVVE